MELPVVCNHCRQEVMVDMEKLERRFLHGLFFGHGYKCPECNKWNRVFLTTRALDEKIDQLQKTPVTHPSFWYRFTKAYKRSQELQERSL